MYRHEIKLIVKQIFFTSSWLITEIYNQLITEIYNQLMLYREIIAVWSEIRTKTHKYTAWTLVYSCVF